MNRLTITIAITDPEALAEYEDVAEEIIADDFLNQPFSWFDGADIEVEKEG